MRRYKLPLLAIAILGIAVFFLLKSRRDHQRADNLISEVVGSEELILKLTPRLGEISKDLMNLRLPGNKTHFADTVKVTDISVKGNFPGQSAGGELTSIQEIGIASNSQEIAGSKLSLWSPLLKHIHYFEHAKFKIVKGGFLSDQHESFECLVKFSGLARNTADSWSSLSGKQIVTWKKQADGDWKISQWKTKSLTTTSSKQRFFSDRLDEALPKFSDRARARLSVHEEEVIKYYQSGKTKARSYDFSPIAMSQKPAVSIVDIDDDGFDDLYIMVSLGTNLLLRNRGDGTFEEAASTYELAFKGNSTCGLFADFDNDGDQDLMLGRSLERSVYLENTGSWYRAKELDFALPALVTSMSAVDYNKDGLLDVYFCTYRLGALGSGDSGLGEANPSLNWPERLLSPTDAAEFRRRYRDETNPQGGIDFLNQVGPPNVFLVNQGNGNFAPAPEGPQVNVWKNSLQATWSDYDDDGDPDLYLANDFSSDHLFRNDGPDGFVDVTEESGANTYGFAMGASFGDYDQDGKQDLYVSNMFSKAGRRILSKFEGIDRNYLHSVNGNFLYRQEQGHRFKHVSGLEPPSLLVAESGWSWGGQFWDFDNDGDLDIHALSGYFTAPKELASQVDL
ncbi:VCBS repeat-containing protein [Akkermansiaceae bacterium]|nr:VCBS repeat-containing protein [Akkermansiaceae bacterium]MDA7888317.1 VCBS repeat-containing protein [Akkermansiaceae bacterium]